MEKSNGIGRRRRIKDVVYELGDYTLPQSPFGRVTMTLDEDSAGRLICTKITVEATQDHPEVTATDLRNLPLSAYRDQVFAAAGWRPEVEVIADGVFRITGGMAAPNAKVVANKRRNAINDDSLRKVAELIGQYPKTEHDRADAAASQEAYSAIMDYFGCQKRSAQNWVKRAQEAGLV